MLGLIALWFRQVREAERASGEGGDQVSLPDKSKLFEALQRLPISFGMAMRVRAVEGEKGEGLCSAARFCLTRGCRWGWGF